MGSEQHHQRALQLGRRNAARVTPRYRSLLLHWLGRSLRRAGRVERAPLLPVEPGQVSVTWGGHATALVRYHSLTIVCDPMLGRSVRGVRREHAPGLGPDDLAAVDLVLVSHAAAGHLHLPSLEKVSRRATVVVPPRAAARVSPLGFARLIELSAGNGFEFRGVHVEAAPVRHGSQNAPAQAYVLRGEGPSLLFCGASGYFDGFAQIGRRHRPDLALLPIAGYWPPSFRERHMSPIDALYAFEDLGARVMIPIAHGTFALSYELIHDPERWLAEIVAQRDLDAYVAMLAPGESRLFASPGWQDEEAPAGKPTAPTADAPPEPAPDEQEWRPRTGLDLTPSSRGPTWRPEDEQGLFDPPPRTGPGPGSGSGSASGSGGAESGSGRGGSRPAGAGPDPSWKTASSV